MYKILRIVFCILAVTCVAATIFIFAYFSWFGFIPLGGAVLFGFLMVLFKNLQQAKEFKENPPPPVGDFITGPVAKSEENNEDEK